ncbi:TPA: UbiA family prenyltransferase [archaeon]|uniref:Digeranylgeranylglyceryl phosphate synthase n=1 Tax=Candidatus Naiadarchaeum limnaeum TaxID=2756139 RepID=A0A832UT18_9ARCH|nr:UbiA family prenyltransferase [Candidatus Naiadarchaeum limnaeum]
MGGKKISLVNNVKILVEISRPINILMVIFGVVITLLAGLERVPPFELLLPAVIAAASIAAAGNAINDYYDIQIDRINRPDRPLPSGKITQRGIWAYAIVLFAVGIIVSLLLAFSNFVLALVNSVLLGVYAYRLKRSGFFGDIVISYLVASVFIFAALAIHSLKIGFILAVAAFFTNAAREVLKDLEDMRGDKLFGARTLPTLIGRKKSVIIVSSFLVVSILVSPFPFTLGILDWPYLAIVIIADLIFAYIIYLLNKKADQKTVAINQRLIKFGALIGLFAFLAGALPI